MASIIVQQLDKQGVKYELCALVTWLVRETKLGQVGGPISENATRATSLFLRPTTRVCCAELSRPEQVAAPKCGQLVSSTQPFSETSIKTTVKRFSVSREWRNRSPKWRSGEPCQ